MVVTKKGYKFMRIFSMIISVIAFVASLSGCSSYPHQNWLEDDSLDKVAEEKDLMALFLLWKIRTKKQSSQCFLNRLSRK